jgi:rubrerythrin
MVDEKKKQEPKKPELMSEKVAGGGTAYQKGSAQKEQINPAPSKPAEEKTNVEGSRRVTSCPNCGTDLTNERADIERCPKCGADLSVGRL